MIEQIKERVAELIKERDSFIAQANAQIQAYQAAIGELERLIAPAEQPTEYIEQALPICPPEP